MNGEWLDRRPLLLAIAGPNGAGKSTFCQAHVVPSGLRLVNADTIAAEYGVDAYAAARIADRLRRQLVAHRESFAFETVYSDPVGDKLAFLRDAAAVGYTTVLCFIGLSSSRMSEDRVTIRVSQGGHDVPPDKIRERYPRTLVNLKLSIAQLPYVLIFDNSDLAQSFRRVAVFENGSAKEIAKPPPRWLRPVISGSGK